MCSQLDGCEFKDKLMFPIKILSGFVILRNEQRGREEEGRGKKRKRILAYLLI
jgi:hypothetical protein